MKKTTLLSLAASIAVLFNSISHAQTPATLTDLVGGAPTPGTDDIANLTFTGANEPDGLNYYIDNPQPPGQIFLTGSNPEGYNLNSLAILTGGGGGGSVTLAQYFVLRI
jgi:hypothetical protein